MFDPANLPWIGALIARVITFTALIPIIAIVRPFPFFLQSRRDAKFALGAALILLIVWNVFRVKVIAVHEPSVRTYVAWGMAWFVMAVGLTGAISLLWPYAVSTRDRRSGEKRFLRCAALLAIVLIPAISYWAFL